MRSRFGRKNTGGPAIQIVIMNFTGYRIIIAKLGDNKNRLQLGFAICPEGLVPLRKCIVLAIAF